MLLNVVATSSFNRVLLLSALYCLAAKYNYNCCDNLNFDSSRVLIDSLSLQCDHAQNCGVLFMCFPDCLKFIYVHAISEGKRIINISKSNA